jgi:hypothetical protein
VGVTATTDDIYNLLNGNPPYPGDFPNAYQFTVDSVDGNRVGIDHLKNQMGDRSFGTVDTLFSLLYAILNNSLDTVLNEIGTPPTVGDTIFALLAVAKSDAHSAYTNTNTILTNLATINSQLGYPTPNAANIAVDFVNTRTAFSIVDTLNTLVKARLGDPLGALGDLLGHVEQFYETAAHLQESVTFAEVLAQLAPAPSLDRLGLGSLNSVPNDTEVVRPAGAYGIKLAVNVPAGWARHAGSPTRFIPAPLHIAYNSTIGLLGNPENVAVAFPIIYPLASAVYSFTIHLEPGITAEYAWLSLP